MSFATQIFTPEFEKLIGELIKKSVLDALSENSLKNKELLTKKEVATMLKCTTKTVESKAKLGILPKRYIGSSIRFKYTDVIKLIKTKSKAA